MKLALELTLDYVKQREAFGKPIWKFKIRALSSLRCKRII